MKNQFSGEATLKTIPKEPLKMLLEEDLYFYDQYGQVWKAPVGSIVDGASIPKAFWRLIGGPWSGLYKKASIIHDVYCQTKVETHKSVHNMFKEAMIVSGVGSWKAWWMFKAVQQFGPKW